MSLCATVPNFSPSLAAAPCASPLHHARHKSTELLSIDFCSHQQNHIYNSTPSTIATHINPTNHLSSAMDSNCMHTFLDIQRERDQNRANPLGLASWFQLTAPIIGSPSPAPSSSSTIVSGKKPPRCPAPPVLPQPRPPALHRQRKLFVAISPRQCSLRPRALSRHLLRWRPTS
ncbi:hypothetical protein BKA81DRAFT_19975 [Phyllosticta paracitricarpa]